MPIVGHGIDLAENARIAALMERHGDHFLERILTPREIEYVRRYKKPLTHVAGRFAAKEALLKMIGTGWRGGIMWTDMEILPDAAGAPVVTLTGETAAVAQRLGITRILLSISHTREHAVASAIGETGG